MCIGEGSDGDFIVSINLVFPHIVTLFLKHKLFFNFSFISLSQWLTFKLSGITCLVGRKKLVVKNKLLNLRVQSDPVI